MEATIATSIAAPEPLDSHGLGVNLSTNGDKTIANDLRDWSESITHPQTCKFLIQ
jgi:hypothetical protein